MSDEKKVTKDQQCGYLLREIKYVAERVGQIKADCTSDEDLRRGNKALLWHYDIKLETLKAILGAVEASTVMVTRGKITAFLDNQYPAMQPVDRVTIGKAIWEYCRAQEKQSIPVEDHDHLHGVEDG